MDRRNFLRTGSLAALGTLAIPSLAMPASVRNALGGADNKSAVAAAMNHFGVTEADLKKSACRCFGKRRRLCRPLF